MASPIACMGGWCARRENCGRYHAEGPVRAYPFEHLCRGRTSLFVPIVPESESPPAAAAAKFPVLAGTFRPFERRA